jgi:hypothetical protein
MRLNACELEIDLMCRGLRVPSDAPLGGSRPVSRTRAGLGSGLELVIPTGSRLKSQIWANVPVAEPFAAVSPYRLACDGGDGGTRVVDDRNGNQYPVSFPRAPAWYSRLTTGDVPMNQIGVLQGTYLGIYVNPVCSFWSMNPKLNCRFCTTGQNVGAHEAAAKTVSDVVETCRAAKEESGITFVHLNGGFQGTRGLEFIKPYVQAIKDDVGLLVGVQLAPERNFRHYDELAALGVDHFSFCVELFDRRMFEEICPGKARVHGQSLYFGALKHCVQLLPHGAVSGEIIAGIEPIDFTIDAIDLIVDLGAFPTVCIFRPTVGSDMESWPPPSYAEMRRVMAHVYEACRRRWFPIGIAPNIEVSIVVTPDDAALLAERNASFYGYEAYRRLLRVAAGPAFRRRTRPGYFSGRRGLFTAV